MGELVNKTTGHPDSFRGLAKGQTAPLPAQWHSVCYVVETPRLSTAKLLGRKGLLQILGPDTEQGVVLIL